MPHVGIERMRERERERERGGGENVEREYEVCTKLDALIINMFCEDASDNVQVARFTVSRSWARQGQMLQAGR